MAGGNTYIEALNIVFASLNIESLKIESLKIESLKIDLVLPSQIEGGC